MKLLLFGATGMIGQGVLRQALVDPDVTAVVTITRVSTGTTHPKLREIVRADVSDLSGLDAELASCDACLFCLGVSAVGMTEEAYSKLTHDLTLAVANRLVALNPAMTFLYISGAGTDATEKGRSMWARVKGKTENDLLRLPFKASYMLRPGYIQPLHGIKSKTRLYRVIYNVMAPVSPLLRRLFPRAVTDTDNLSRAMLRIARTGAPRSVLENADLNALGA
jgi:uncharacterized protein YbjT (DUF2867 family)